jgi:hypothetical protein
MGGEDEKAGSLFSCVDLESRIPPEAPAASDPRDRERGAFDIRCRLRRALFADWPFFDPAGAIAPGHAAATVLCDPLGTAFGRAARLRSVVPWFFGFGIDDRVWDVSTFSKNRDSLLDGDV